MTQILQIENKEQLDAVRPFTDMGNGTYQTCVFGLLQGRPVYVAIIGE